MCSPSAGAGAWTVPGVRDIFTGTPSWRTGPIPGCSHSTTISRSRTSPESRASSRSSTGSIIASCSSLNAFHSDRVRERKISAISAQASEPVGSYCLEVRSSRPTPAQKRAQNCGSSAPIVM